MYFWIKPIFQVAAVKSKHVRRKYFTSLLEMLSRKLDKFSAAFLREVCLYYQVNVPLPADAIFEGMDEDEAHGKRAMISKLRDYAVQHLGSFGDHDHDNLTSNDAAIKNCRKVKLEWVNYQTFPVTIIDGLIVTYFRRVHCSIFS